MAASILDILLKQGVAAWNQWRLEHPQEKIEFSRVDLRGVDLRNANFGGVTFYRSDLSKADLRGAHLGGVDLYRAKLNGAQLNGCYMVNAVLHFAELENADLPWADLTAADLGRCNLTGADLYGANLELAIMVEANVTNARLTNSRVYGISAWGIKGIPYEAKDLIVTPSHEPPVSVDDLDLAQFIYLLLNRKKLQNFLDTITSKAILLLGRFTPERKAVLDALADELRKYNLLPIIFDFERSMNRDFTETIKILAGLSLFVIVDLTKPKSAPQELTATVPDYQIPFVPILEEGEDPYSMFVDLMKYDWVLKPLVKYRTKEVLLANFKSVILDRAWKKHVELQRKKDEELEMISIDQMMEQKE